MATASGLGPDSTIQVEQRTYRNLGTSILSSLLKPFSSVLTKPPSRPVPAGSPELQVHDSVYKSCNVHQRRVAGIRVYDINARSSATAKYLEETQGRGGEHEARLAGKQEPPRHRLNSDPTASYDGHDIRSHDFARTKVELSLIHI